MAQQRITIEQLKDYMHEISQAITTDATVDDVPENQKWVIDLENTGKFLHTTLTMPFVFPNTQQQSHKSHS